MTIHCAGATEKRIERTRERICEAARLTISEVDSRINRNATQATFDRGPTAPARTFQAMSQTPENRSSFAHTANQDANGPLFMALLCVSVALHLALGWAARGTKLETPGISSGLTPAQRLALRSESAVRARLVEPEIPFAPKELTAEKERAAALADVAPSPILPVSDVPGAALLPPPAATSPELDFADRFPKIAPEGAAAVAATDAPTPWTPRAELLEIASRFANDDMATLPRLEIPDAIRSPFAPDETSPSPALPPPGFSTAEAAFGPPPAAFIPPSLESAAAAAATASAATTETIETIAPAPLPPVPGAPEEATPEMPSAFLPEIPEEAAPARPLDDVLNAAVSVFRPARPDGFAYFRVDVSRKGTDSLPPIPRDALFAIDVSRSIAPDRIQRCAEEFLALATHSLHPEDRFEVLAFNSTNRYAFGGTWQSPNGDSLRKAAEFIASLKPGGNTDLYGAMRSAFALPETAGRARAILLASDGVPTTGDVQTDSELIGKLSAANAGRTSIFGVGIARKTDEFLLSMLSLCNRGERASMSRDRYDVGRAVKSGFERIGTPVLQDLRFVFDAGSGAQTAPTAPANLSLERPLTIWGRIPDTGANEILFEARGENGGRTYDMVFALPLGDCAPGDGDPDVAAQWARARLYDLVAAYVKSPSPALLSEMAAVGRTFGLPIPFKDRLRD